MINTLKVGSTFLDIFSESDLRNCQSGVGQKDRERATKTIKRKEEIYQSKRNKKMKQVSMKKDFNKQGMKAQLD